MGVVALNVPAVGNSLPTLPFRKRFRSSGFFFRGGIFTFQEKHGKNEGL